MLLFDICRTMIVVARRLDEFVGTMGKMTITEGAQSRGSFQSVEIPGLAEVRAVNDEILGNLKRVSQMALNIPHYLLGTALVGNPSFDKVHKELVDKYGINDVIVKTVAVHRDALVGMIDMRNAIEHPREGQRLTITEMRLGAAGQLEEPKLVFEHKGSTKEFLMVAYLQEMAARVFNLCEELFVSSVEKWSLAGCVYVVAELEPDKIDPECPMKYKGFLQLRTAVPTNGTNS